MRSISISGGIRAMAALLMATCALSLALAGDQRKLINAGEDHVAIRGYDTVAYFTDGKPTKGKPEFSHKWRDVTWQFSSAKHKELFVADPQKYVPQFGGFCAMAMTNGVVLEVDPNAWTIVEDKLYLNFSLKGRGKFRQDLKGNIAKSDAHWAKLQEKQ